MYTYLYLYMCIYVYTFIDICIYIHTANVPDLQEHTRARSHTRTLSHTHIHTFVGCGTAYVGKRVVREQCTYSL